MTVKARKKKVTLKKFKAKVVTKSKYSMLPLRSTLFHPTERRSLLT